MIISDHDICDSVGNSKDTIFKEEKPTEIPNIIVYW